MKKTEKKKTGYVRKCINMFCAIVACMAIMAFIVVGIINFSYSLKEKKDVLPVVCITECLQDFKNYGTANYFSMISHASFNVESRDAHSLSEKEQEICCTG